MAGFADFMEAMGAFEDDEDRAPAIQPEAAAMECREFFDRYQAFLSGCLFKPGELVIVRKGHVGAATTAIPYVVLETRDAPEPNFTGETNSSAFGQRLDMRVMTFHSSGERVAYWVESINFERWPLSSALAASLAMEGK